MHKAKIFFLSALSVIIVVIGIVILQPEKSLIESFPITEQASKPVPNFAEYEQVVDKKKAFFSYLKPEVITQNQFILSQREFIHAMRAKHIAGESISDQQVKQIEQLKKDYRVKYDSLDKTFSALLLKVDLIPVELVLVQTANESAWGTSRFARKGYNFFGLWCFKKGCGFVPKRRNKGAVHEVAKFEDLSTAMHAYMLNLNRHNAYAELRKIRATQRENLQQITATALTEGLHKYSERGEDYINELQQMIRVNKELIDNNA